MVKLLLIGVIPLSVTAAIIFYLARPQFGDNKIVKNLSKSETFLANDPPQTLPDEQLTMTKGEFLKLLEASNSALNLKIDALAKKQGVSVSTLSTPSPTPVAVTTTGPLVAYIPLASSGSSSSVNSYENITGTEIEIDSNLYPGYKKMYLETQMRIFQGNGTGEGRLYNKTDGSGISGSEVSVTSENYTLKTSSGFTIASGKKTYVVQLKSNTGYSVDLFTTRIRVEF